MSGQAKIDTRIFSRLLAFAKPYKWLLVLAFLCTIVLALLTPMRPLLLIHIVNTYVIDETTRNQDTFLFWTLIILGMLFIEAVLQFLATYLCNLLAQSVIRDIRIRVLRHITTFRMRYFDKTPVWNLVTRDV